MSYCVSFRDNVIPAVLSNEGEAMIPSWNHVLEGVIERLYQRIVHEPGLVPDVYRDAALKASGVPVYCDMGGCLIITPKGDIVFCEHDTQRLSVVVEEKWRLVALVAASEKYGELHGLKPVKPSDARTCHACNGSGRILANGVRCGECWGTGWLPSTAGELDHPVQ